MGSLRQHARQGSAPRSEDDREALNYIRSTVRRLDGTFDQEALWLLCGQGVLCLDDPAQLNDAVDRLRNPHDLNDRALALFEQIQPALPEDQQKLLTKYDDLHTEQVIQVTETAYLLGISVGRRLGPGALTLKGGAR